MAVESARMADLNKMVAPKPAAPLPPGKVRRPPPENFKGCKCPTWGCKNGYCPCYAASYPCTSKCKCQGCKNILGARESDSDTGALTWCKCKVSRCKNRYCRCVKDSHRCSSKCQCENCRNQNDVRGSEPVQADDTSSMARGPPQMGSRGASKRPRTE